MRSLKVRLFAVLFCLPMFADVAAEASAVERGEYVYRAAGCGGCHESAEEPAKGPAGGQALQTPFGVYHSPNITPHSLYGIGKWSVEDLARALHEGISPVGYRYSPVFPYTSYTRMRGSDVADLYAYLMSLPPVARANRPHEVRWFLSGDTGNRAWRLLNFRAGRFTPNPGRDARWNRGAYLATALAHCGECHTPRGPLGAMDLTRPYAGNADGPNDEATPNITPHPRDGIGEWALDDLVNYFQSGIMPDGDSAEGAMAEVIDNGLSHLTEADREALSLYVRSLPPVAGGGEHDHDDH